MSKVKFIDILDRTTNGPVCETKDWDMKVIFKTVSEKLHEYGLEGVYTPDNPLNSDSNLADDFWKAGFDLAVNTGMLCQTTNRIIKFTERELREGIEEAPSRMQLGIGKDQFTVMTRTPSDGKRISTWLGPFGISVDEDLYIPICQSAAAYTIIDALIPACLHTVYNRDLRGGTPYETLAGKYEVTLQKEALRRARRFGMPAQGGCTSPTEYGNFGGVGIPGAADPKNNLNVALCPSELKVDYRILHKVAHFLNCETYIYAGHFSMIGGFAGSIEGAALTSIAAAILLTSVCQASFQYVPTLNALLQCNSSRETAWTTSISAQALSQNTHLLTGGVVNPVAGPCTEMMLYEIAVSALFNSVSGFSFSEGVRSAGGKYPNYSTGLESKFAGEILKSNTGMSLDTAKEIIKTILPKYEQNLERPPKGKSFTECFDLKSLTPSKEWLDIYDKVRTNLENLGVSFNAESN